MDHDFVPSPHPRKRKLEDGEEDIQPQESLTPRQPQRLCPSTIMQTGCVSKRPRIDKVNRMRRVPRRTSSRRLHRCGPPRIGSDLEDMGITLSSTSASGSIPTTSNHLLSPSQQPYTIQPYNDYPHIVFGPHVPSLYPPINKHSLNDLEPSHVLRNPQLRHDLLFDPGLHFRPASHRKKDDMSDRYWDAVIKELNTGCTCLSFTSDGEPVPCLCICELTPTSTPLPWIVSFPNVNTVTVRTPSRIRHLLEDFLDLLLLVIQPLSRTATAYLNPTNIKSQMEEHAAHARYIRSVFDPALIEQELLCRVFDPSGVFELIADTLKQHCAPMRDPAISAFAAKGINHEKGGCVSSADAALALRMCMDVLELMQLDIANHQLHCLRPFITKSASSYELEVFESEAGPDSALDLTHVWLEKAEQALEVSHSPVLMTPYFTESTSWSTLSRTTQTYVSVVRGLVDLVFCPPVALPPVSHGPPATPLRQPIAPINSLPNYPETTFLDNTRLLQLSGDALDLIALHMYLLLFRQLLNSGQVKSSLNAEPTLSQLKSLRNEIIDISRSRPGHTILPSASDSETQMEKMDRRRKLQDDIILHIVFRVTQIKSQGSDPSQNSIDQPLLTIAQRWAENHLHNRSNLFLMLRDRIRDLVFRAILVLVPPPSCSALLNRAIEPGTLFRHLFAERAASGLEPLRSHFRLISERTSTLVHFHINTYLALYENKVRFGHE